MGKRQNINACHRLRMALGWTMDEMAREVGISRQAWLWYETGKNKPAPDNGWAIVDIAKANGVQLEFHELYPRS